MPIIVHDNILNSKDDAIVNSLGYKSNVVIFGKICDAISKAAHDEIEEDIIKKGIDLDFCDTFAIDAKGDLKCKKIINVITPYRWKDDKNLSRLELAYFNCFNLAYNLGLKSISVPMIGASSANGYTNESSFEAAYRIGEAFEKNHPDFIVKLDIFYCDCSLTKIELKEYQERSFNRTEKYKDIYFSNLDVSNLEATEIGVVKKTRARKPRNQDDVTLKIDVNYDRGLSSEKSYREKPLESSSYLENASKANAHFEYARSKMTKNEPLGDFINDYIYDMKDHNDDATTAFWSELGGIINSFKDPKNDNDTLKFVLKGSKEYKEKLGKAVRLKRDWSLHTITHGKFQGCKAQGWKKPCKIELIVTCAYLKMSRDEILWMLNYCGYYLSNYIEEDIALMQTLNQYELSSEKGWMTLLRLFNDNVGVSLYKLWRDGTEIPVSMKAYERLN